MERRIEQALLLIASLVFAVSLFSLLSESIYLGTEAKASFGATDLANLILGVPYLLVGTWLLHREHRVWLLVVPGALFYVVYVYIPYIIALDVNILFLAYILIISLSLYLLVIVLATGEYMRIKSEFVGEDSFKSMIGVLLLLGVMVGIRQSMQVVSAAFGMISASSIDIAMWFDDLVLGCPALFLSAYYLHRRKGIGYVIAPAMLLSYAVLSLGLLPYFWFENRLFGTPVQWDGVVIVILMALLCLVPFIRYLRNLVKA